MKQFKKLISILLLSSIMVLTLSACGSDINDSNVIVTIEGEKTIHENELKFYLRQVEAYFEGYYGPDVWDMEVGTDETVADLAKENAMESIIRATLLSMIAQERGIELTKDEKKEMDELAKGYFNNLENAKEDGITEELMKKSLYNEALANKVVEDEMKDFEYDEEELELTLLSDPSYVRIDKYGYEGLAQKVRARHILIKTVDDSLQPLSEEEIKAAKTRAEEVLAKAKAGEDFEALVKEYSEDPGSVDNGGEYTFKRGEMAEEFEVASFSMEPGEISDLVETLYGYHIIKLEEIIEPTEEEIQLVKDQEQQIKDYYLNDMKMKAFNDIYKGWREEYSVEIDEDLWDAIEVRESRNEETADTDASNEEDTEAQEDTDTENK